MWAQELVFRKAHTTLTWMAVALPNSCNISAQSMCVGTRNMSIPVIDVFICYCVFSMMSLVAAFWIVGISVQYDSARQT